MSITCGNRARHNGTTGTHATTAAVRACFLDPGTFTCPDLYYVRDRFGQVYDEDGRVVTAECGALAWELSDGTGATCENGHTHIRPEYQGDQEWLAERAAEMAEDFYAYAG
jgi:hypothetical protein